MMSRDVDSCLLVCDGVFLKVVYRFYSQNSQRPIPQTTSIPLHTVVGHSTGEMDFTLYVDMKPRESVAVKSSHWTESRDIPFRLKYTVAWNLR